MAEEYLTDEEYLKRIRNHCISSKDNRNPTKQIDDDADIQFRAKMYYPIELSPPLDSFDELLDKYDEENNSSNIIKMVQTGEDADDNALTKDDSSFFESHRLRKMIFAPAGSSKTLFTQKLVLYLADTDLFPLYLQCSELKAHDESDDFIDLAHKMQVIEIGKKNLDEIIKNHSNNGLLIIDGLDECSEKDRKDFAKSLNTFLSEHNDVGFIITSRLRQYSEQELAYPKSTDFHYIKKLDDSAVFSFIRKWERTFMSIKGEADETYEAEVKRITEIINSFNEKCDENIRSLVRIPMYLSNMLKMREKYGKDLPSNIEQYYKDYIDLKMRGVLKDSDFYKKLIKYIAYWMSCCPQKRYVSIDKKTLTDSVLCSYMSTIPPGKYRKPVEEILDTLENKMSVLMRVSLDRSDEYRFEHLSLQELLTAKALLSKKYTTDFDGYIRKDCNPIDFIRRITYDDGWKEFDQIIRYVLQLSKQDSKEDIEYLLKKKGIYDSVNTMI